MKEFFHHLIGFHPEQRKEFPGQQPGEEVELMTVFHWVSLVPFFAQISFVIMVFIILFAWTDFFSDFSPVGRFYLLSLVGVILLHVICYRLFNFFLKVIIITNHRLIDIRNSVFLIRRRESISMTNIQDFRYEQHGIFPRLFHYGNLLVLGSSSEVHYEFCHVPRVNKIHHILGEIHERAIQEQMMPRRNFRSNQEQQALPQDV